MGTTENVQAWSTTAATNANADTAINWAEGQDAASVNNSARSMMAAVAKHEDDTGGALTASGTFNALTVTTNQVLSATQIAAGLRLLVKALSTNTAAAVTFAPDGLTPAPIKCNDGSALAVGSIVAGALLDLVYNTGTSEWWAANIPPIGEFLTSSQPSGGIATTTPTSFVSINLTPGDWDVWGSAIILTGSAPCGAFLLGFSTTVNVFLTTQGLTFSSNIIGNGTSLATAPVRFYVSSPTTVWLTLQCNFTPGVVNCSAIISARRFR